MITLEKQHRLKQRNEQLERELQQREREHEQKIVLLKRQIAALKFQPFGSPRCEKISDEQLCLALPRVGEARTRLPEHLEEVREEIIPAEVEADPQAYVRIGEEVTEELDIIPGRLIKRVIVRPKFKRKEQLDAVPFVASLPARVVPGGIPSARFVAHLLACT